VSAHLAGTWLLQSWTARDEHGRADQPFDDDPQGVLIISPDGWLSVQLAAPRRPALGGGVGPLGGPAEQSAAFLTYVAYAGRYRTGGDRLTTTVDVSLIPDWAGSDQVRAFEVDGDLLVLRAVPPPGTASLGDPARPAPSAGDRSADEPGSGGVAGVLVRAMRLSNGFVWRRAA